ncbi:MAG: DUF1905 domain-containing protein [Actinomycetes bacterium]
MELKLSGEIWYWRGPPPFYFVTVPAKQSGQIKAIAARVTYGWGVIPVHVTIGKTSWSTSLFPKDGLYAVPIKNVIREKEKLDAGVKVTLTLTIDESI